MLYITLFIQFLIDNPKTRRVSLFLEFLQKKTSLFFYDCNLFLKVSVLFFFSEIEGSNSIDSFNENLNEKLKMKKRVKIFWIETKTTLITNRNRIQILFKPN